MGAAGAKDVILFADLSNPTSNALYQRLGYRRLTDWAVYDFSCAAPPPAQPSADHATGTHEAVVDLHLGGARSIGGAG